MDNRDPLAVEYELEARNRRASRLARMIKAITYLALATIVIAILFTGKEEQVIIVSLGFMLILCANLFGLYKNRKFEAYIWRSLKRGYDEQNSDSG